MKSNELLLSDHDYRETNLYSYTHYIHILRRFIFCSGVSVLAEVFSDEVRRLCYLVAAYIRTQRSRSVVLYISHLLPLIKDEVCIHYH